MLLSNSFRPDPRVLKEAASLADSGFRITILCWDREAEHSKTETVRDGVEVIRIQHVASSYGIGARQLLRLPKFWWALFPHLDRLKPDIIHCHDFDTLPAGLLWGKLHGTPVIYDAHEYYADLCKPRLKGFGGRLLYQMIRIGEHIGARAASAVVTVDESLGEVYRGLNKRVVIIGHYPSKNLAAIAAPVFTRNHLTLLYTGRLSVDRGLLTYVRILRQLLAWGIPARLRLVGVFTPSAEEQTLAAQCQGIENAVEISSWVHYDQIPSILREADVGLCILLPEPRYVVSFPVKLFEYMAAGLPVLASNFPPIESIVQNERCGNLVNPLDDPQIAASALRDWWQNHRIPQTMGENGRQAVLDRYNWETLTQELIQLYRNVSN